MMNNTSPIKPCTNERARRNSLVSRNITVDGHRTSVRLEPAMWSGLGEIVRRERISLHEIGTAIAQQKPANTSLTAAIRVFLMAYFRAAATEDGHTRAGHGRGATVVTSIAPAFVALTPAQALPYIIGERYVANGAGR